MEGVDLMRRVTPPGVETPPALAEVKKYSRCPRCGGAIPNWERRGEYPGAISRVDNQTEICSECGTMEAMEDFVGNGPMPIAKWWQTSEDFAKDIAEMS